MSNAKGDGSVTELQAAHARKVREAQMIAEKSAGQGFGGALQSINSTGSYDYAAEIKRQCKVTALQFATQGEPDGLLDRAKAIHAWLSE
jgi:hypothetical protein